MYKVRVKDSLFGGIALIDGVSLSFKPAVYDVDINVAGGLVFKGADTRNGGDLIVSRSSYTELEDFPIIDKNPYIEILSGS